MRQKKNITYRFVYTLHDAFPNCVEFCQLINTANVAGTVSCSTTLCKISRLPLTVFVADLINSVFCTAHLISRMAESHFDCLSRSSHQWLVSITLISISRGPSHRPRVLSRPVRLSWCWHSPQHHQSYHFNSSAYSVRN